MIEEWIDEIGWKEIEMEIDRKITGWIIEKNRQRNNWMERQIEKAKGSDG